MKRNIILLLTLFVFLQANGKTGRQIIEENGFEKSVGPLLETDWSQNGGENSLLPMVSENAQAVTGCGATAMAQLMKFWKHPEHGTGSNYYYWDEVYHPAVLHADFQHTYYDWSNMILRYKGNKSVTDTQREAVSRLMADIGVALEMRYTINDSEVASTATNIEYIHTALKKYFGYNPNSRLLRFINGAYTMDEWMTMVYKELSEHRPILMGARYGKYNHIFIADGYDENGLVHLNLGKAGSSTPCNQNAYYDLTQTGITYTEDMRMLVEVYPAPLKAELTKVHVTDAGTLKEVLGGERESRRVCRLKITGSINSTDISWLRELSKETTGQLSFIDLSECMVINNELPSSAFDGCYTLQEIILCDHIGKIGRKAFYNCKGLYAIHLPENLRTIEKYAFTRCRSLTALNLPVNITTIETDPFAYVKLDQLSLENDNPSYEVVNNAIIRKNGRVLLSMPVKTFGDYKVQNGITEIGASAFNCCEGIRDVYIPVSVFSIGQEAFKSCPRLSDFYCYGTTAPVLAANVFTSSPNLNILHVPAGCRQEYLDNGWTMFKEILEDLPVLKQGDVNQDGTVDISDIVAVINAIAGDNTFWLTADVNGDNEYNISDVVAIINAIAKNSK